MEAGSVETSGAATAPGAQGLHDLLLPFEAPKLDAASGNGQPAWLKAPGGWRLLARPRALALDGEALARFELESGEVVTAFRDDDGTVRIPFDPEEAYCFFISERWREYAAMAALSPGQLGLYYRLKRLLPGSWLLAARRMLVRWTGLPEFPRWPLEDSVVQLIRFYALCLLVEADEQELEFRWFWPDAHRAALMLTHDVESAAGLRLAIELADVEEERGFRSSFNIVAAQYPVDYGIVRELDNRGFEIGLHGLYHDRSLFSSRREFERQLPGLRDAAAALGAKGFRSPATHRVVDWLPELPVEYDTTMFHSDPYEPQPGGCCTLWPFSIGRLVEMPYTLPQDHTLFTLLGERSAETWLRLVDAIEARFGLVHCLSHPDPGYLGDPAKRSIYIDFLDALGERRSLWRALPRDVAAWWRWRESAADTDPRLGRGTMRRDGEGAVLEAPLR
jgi:peptidoglycan/xylan/chitin deacetylase (PgdA/CDA1 family)